MAKKSKTVDGKRWRQWTEEQARAALEEMSRSGLSPLEFARSKGVSRQRLAYWRKRLAAPPAFVSLALTRDVSRPARWIDVLVGELVVRLPEDVDAVRVARIVGALSRRGEGC